MRVFLTILILAVAFPTMVEAVDKKAWPHSMGLDAERRYKAARDKEMAEHDDGGMGAGPVLPDGKKRQHAFDSLDDMISDLIDWLDTCLKGGEKGYDIYKKRLGALEKRLEIEQNRYRNEQSQTYFSDDKKAEQKANLERIARNIARLKALLKDLPSPEECREKAKKG